MKISELNALIPLLTMDSPNQTAGGWAKSSGERLQKIKEACKKGRKGR